MMPLTVHPDGLYPGPVEVGPAGTLAVDVRGLEKSYSGVQAVRGVDLEIRVGEVFALLELTGWAIDHQTHLDGLQVIRPSLEDIYLSLTGPPSGGEQTGRRT